MKCQNCNEKLNTDLFNEYDSIVKSFFPDSVLDREHIEDLHFTDTIFYRKMADFIITSLQADDSFRQKYEALRIELRSINIECPNCKEPIFSNIRFNLSAAERTIYGYLCKLEVKVLIQEFIEIHNTDPKPFLDQFKYYTDKRDFLISNRQTYYNDIQEKIYDRHQFIETFEPHERGGDGIDDILQYLSELLTNDILRSAIYDLIKLGTVSFFTAFIIKPKYRKIKKETLKKISEYLEWNVKVNMNSSDLGAFRLLRKKERKRFCKKLINRESKKIIKEIEKRINDADH